MVYTLKCDKKDCNKKIEAMTQRQAEYNLASHKLTHKLIKHKKVKQDGKEERK